MRKDYTLFFTKAIYAILSLIVLALTHSQINAQATIDLSKPVGSPKGSGGASGSGGVSYSIPIEVLPGTKGLQPSISLNYNSQGGDGNFGWGWNLSALSFISRAGKTNYYNGKNAPISYTNTDDAFVLDGQRLFVISGTNGADGAIYGTENETFNKIESTGGTEVKGPLWFKVTTKSGMVLEYGNATNTKLLTDDGLSNEVWLLNRITDINGNYEDFIYGINNTDRNFVLAEIDYTGNAAKSISPYNRVKFTYTAKPNWLTLRTYQSGASINSPFLLNSITVENSSGTTIKSYQCTYNQVRNQYFLQTFAETGADNTSLNPLKFSYGSNLTAADVSVSSQYSLSFSFNNTFSGDVSGDGKEDIIAGNLTYDNNGWPHFDKYSVIDDFSGGGGIALAYDYQCPDNTYATQVHAESNLADFSTSDYDGDSKKDVLMAIWTLTSGQMILNSIRINYSRLYNDIYGPTYETKDYLTIPHVSQYSQDFKYAYNGGTNFICGDFDGDGAEDYILVVGMNSTTSFKAFFSSPQKGIINQEINRFGVEGSNSDPFYAISVANATDVVPVDFDGDGKTEILVQKTNQSYILSVNPAPISSGYNYKAEVLYTTSLIKSGYRVFPGDFNGDGNTDLLVRSSKNDATASWNVLYSSGKTYTSYPFTFQKRVVLQGDNGYDASHLLMVADFNGDGKSDIWHSLDDITGGLHSLHTIYYSNGVPLNGAMSSFTNIETYSRPESINKDLNAPTITGDFNGDGKPDLFSLVSSSARFIYPKPFKEERLLVKATDGFGREAGFNYAVITNNSSIYQRSTNYSYDVQGVPIGQQQNGNPYMVINSPFYVLSSSTFPDGIGGTSYTNYKYTDAVVSSLRGFLGFKQFTTTNNATSISKTVYNEIDPTLLVPHVIRQQTSYLGTSLSDTKITDAITRIAAGSSTDKRYTYRISKTLTVDGITGSAVESNNTYDAYNNITTNVTNKGYMSGTNIVPVETTTTTTVFGIHNTPVPSTPESVTISNARNGQSVANKQTSYTYNTKGNILTTTDFAGTALATTTTNVYDGFGNIIRTDIATPDNTKTPTILYTYNTTGVFLTQKQTSSSIITKTETYTYESKWGLPASTVSSDGLTTSYTYDNGFGRLIKTTVPDGNSISQTLAWQSDGSGYSIASSRDADGGMYSRIYYDLLERKVRTEATGLNNQLSTSNIYYNNKGQVSSTIAPYFLGEAAITTSNTYDNYGRLTNSSNGTSSVAISYTQGTNGQYTTTATNAAAQANSKTQDAAGQIINTVDNGGQLSFSYDSWGNTKTVKIGSTTLVSSVYDSYGRKTSMTDNNAGTINYEYDALGQLTKQTDALNNVYTTAYDAFGRLASRTGSEGVTTYKYYSDDVTGKCNDNISKITGFASDITNYTYDNLSRLVTVARDFDGSTMTKTMTYDNFSNLTTTTYPSGIVINENHDKYENITSTTMGSGTPTTLFAATGMNSRGVYTGYTYGNGRASIVTYDFAKGVPTRYYTQGIQDLNLSFDGQTGNLLSRNDAINSLTETFVYDNLNRLTSSTVTGKPAITISYDNNSGNSLGNVTSKSDIGNYTYKTDKTNAIAYIISTAGGQTPPGVISQNQQDITYTPFLKAATIAENNYLLTYTYGQDQQRIKSVLKLNGAVTETKYYFGNYEKQTINGTTREIHYIEAGNGLCVILVKQGGTTTPYYVYQDNLGSILTVTDAAGAITTQQNFDAWGRNRAPANWKYVNIPAVPDWLYRGYTQHEHLPQFSLVNMNGRMYDPAIARMISPDNYVQEPFNTQSYNRYTYGINNSMSYTDPSGNFFLGSLITAVFDFWKTGLTKGGFEVWNWGSTNFKQAWKSFDPTASWSLTNKALKIDLGQFRTDPNRTGVGQALGLFSRFTWELPQTAAGKEFAHLRNLTGNVDNVSYYGGATLVNNKKPSVFRWGLTLGPYINSQNLSATLNDDIFGHEYGHTLQSKLLGPLYFTSVGIPSFIGSTIAPSLHNREWYETQANRLSLRYFQRFEPTSHLATNWDFGLNPTDYNPTWYWLFAHPPAAFSWWLLF